MPAPNQVSILKSDGSTTPYFTYAAAKLAGTGIFIGRRVYSEGPAAIQIAGSGTKGYVKCDEIICKEIVDTPRVALSLSNFTNQITIVANYIEGIEIVGLSLQMEQMFS